MDPLNWWSDWFLDIEGRHKQTARLIKYLLRTGGGLVWPLFTIVVLAVSWSALTTTFRILFVTFFVLLFWLPICYPYIFENYLNKRRAELREVQKAFYDLSDFCVKQRLWEKVGDRPPAEEKALSDAITNLSDGLGARK